MPRVGNLRPEQIKPLYGETDASPLINRASSPAAAPSDARVETAGTGGRASGGNPALIAREGRPNPFKNDIDLFYEAANKSIVAFTSQRLDKWPLLRPWSPP